jgi:hypothetical protein
VKGVRFYLSCALALLLAAKLVPALPERRIAPSSKGNRLSEICALAVALALLLVFSSFASAVPPAGGTPASVPEAAVSGLRS